MDAASASSGRAIAPGTAAIDRAHQIADPAFEVHPVAAQAIVHQHVFGVVLLVEKDPA